MLDNLLSMFDIGDDNRARLAVLITEACANGVRHADPGSEIDLSITVDDRECAIEVGNWATQFSPGEISADLPDTSATSGHGLPMIAALADDATFLPTQPGRALLRIVKKLT